jgi:hypothetical protein
MTTSTVDVYGTTRAASETVAATQGAEVQMNLNQRGDMLVARALPLYAEYTRMGNSWCVSTPTANAFTYVAAWPTTRAEVVLYNGEAGNGKIYVIDAVWIYNITSMAAAQPMTLLAQMVPTTGTVPTDNAAALKRSRSGKVSYNGKARAAIANTTAGQTTNLWQVIGTSLVPSPTTNLGAAILVMLDGKFVVPPGSTFAVNAVAGTAAGTAIMGISWTEVQLTTG